MTPRFGLNGGPGDVANIRRALLPCTSYIEIYGSTGAGIQRSECMPVLSGPPCTLRSGAVSRSPPYMPRFNLTKIVYEKGEKRDPLHLAIQAGDPTFSPAPRIVQDIKIGTDAGPRPELGREDFALKASVIELFEHFDRLWDGTIDSVEVRHGLPFRVTVERSCGERA